MILYYIKTAIRNFKTNKIIFVGSLLTLCLGALCISFLYSYLDNELSMNEFHKNDSSEIEKIPSKNQHKRQSDIYLMLKRDSPKSRWQVTSPSAYWKFDYKKYPEIDNLVQVKRYPKGEFKFTYKSSSYLPSGLVVDSTFFKIFDFKLSQGNAKTALNNLNSVILSQKQAKIIFGNEDPIGKEIKIREVEDGDFDEYFIVTGIVKIPSNSSISFDYLIPNLRMSNKFGRMGCEFILTKPSFDKDIFLNKIKHIVERGPIQRMREVELGLISLNEVYFNREIDIDYINIFSSFGDKKNNDIILIIIMLILVISVLNFSNLQVIKINSSLKQIGINKINGAKKKHLIYQKITEISLLILLASFIISEAYKLLLPIFNAFFHVALEPLLWEIFILNIVILTILAGLSLIYPIFVITKISILKSLEKKSFSSSPLVGKKIILIIQYTLTFILLITSIIVTKQLDLMLNKDLGFNSKNVIHAKIFYNPKLPDDWKTWTKEERKNKRDKLTVQFESQKGELASHTSIVNVSQGRSPLKHLTMSWKVKGSVDDYTSINTLLATYNYNKVLGLKILEGHFFENEIENLKSGSTQRVVINEAAKRYWGITDFSEIRLSNKSWGNQYEIVGVVKDFNYEHLSVKPQPLVISYRNHWDDAFLIQFQEGKVQDGLKFVENFFNKINPGEIFKYTFLEDEILALYEKEKRLSLIYTFFTIIALFISAIGLFIIALYDTHRRTKEIGIRKVNGATIKEILFMLNKDFIKWVGIAFAIATPISYYTMSKWLENFAYKTELSWWVFALSGVFTLIIALLTVSWQSFKAATNNPVDALRDE